MKSTRSGLLLRRVLAASYDWLLVIAMILVAGLPLPLIPENLLSHPVGRFLILLGMLLIIILYFGLSWLRGGQTVGLRAWRLRLVKRQEGSRLSWMDIGIRLIAAVPAWGIALAGVLWMLIDRDRLCFHDRLSATELQLQPKRKTN